MKQSKKFTVLLALLGAASLILSCGKKDTGGTAKSGKPGLSFTSHSSGSTVSSSLPLVMKGKIDNYDRLDEKMKTKLHLYLMEQSSTEKIWHIEPEVSVDAKGEWSGKTWLGNPRTGNGETYNVCILALERKLKLRNGNHPVARKPAFIGETCISIKRQDK
jgi:outer membrane protein assembly factor BamB